MLTELNYDINTPIMLRSLWLFPLIISFFIACATSPTGRQQLKLIGSKQMDQLGRDSFLEIQKKIPPSNDTQKKRLTTCVVETLLLRNGFKLEEWETVVFKDKNVNAFALPGGKIGIFEGLFTAAHTPSQLAAVIGHEIGHIEAEHGNERVSQQLLIQGGLALSDLILDTDTKTGRTIMNLLGVGLVFGVALPYSRKHELEADYIGLMYLANAGFEPEEAITFWQNMAKVSGKGGPEFLSTHPSSRKRINQIRKHLPAANAAKVIAIEKHGPPDCS